MATPKTKAKQVRSKKKKFIIISLNDFKGDGFLIWSASTVELALQEYMEDRGLFLDDVQNSDIAVIPYEIAKSFYVKVTAGPIKIEYPNKVYNPK